MRIADLGETKPAAGVHTTNPITIAVAAPTAVARLVRTASSPIQTHSVAIGASIVVATIAYSALASFVLLKAIGMVSALAADSKAQGRGMDVTQHGEEAYSNGEGALLVLENVEAQPVVRPAAVATAGGVA
jgi:ammonia channel protein AmtB